LAWERESEKQRASGSKGGTGRRSSPPKSSRDGHRKSQHSHSRIHGDHGQEEPPKKKSRHTLRRRSPHDNIAVDYKSKTPPDRSKRKSKHSTGDARVEPEEKPKEKSRHSSSKPMYRHSAHSKYFGSPPRVSKSPETPKRKSRYSPTSSDTYVNRTEDSPMSPKARKSPERAKRKSKQAQVNADACLDRLPIELKLSILDVLPDIPSLYSITRASPAFYHAYLGQRYPIHSRVITADVDAKIMIEALSLLQASRISRSSRWLEKASSFIDLYAVDRSLCVGPEITGKETMHRIAGFHYIVHNLTSLFSQDALAHRPVIGRPSSRSEKPLTSNETQRFQRALYRYEIFCRLFGNLHRTSQDYAHDQHNFSRVATEFLASFQPWEAEEINCLHRFVCKYFREVIQKCASYLGVEFGWSRYGERVVMRAPNGLNGNYQYKLGEFCFIICFLCTYTCVK